MPLLEKSPIQFSTVNYVNVGHKSLLKNNVCILKDFYDESCSIGNRYLQLKIAYFLAMHAARQFRGELKITLQSSFHSSYASVLEKYKRRGNPLVYLERQT